jgi:hypothetical protein
MDKYQNRMAPQNVKSLNDICQVFAAFTKFFEKRKLNSD